MLALGFVWCQDVGAPTPFALSLCRRHSLSAKSQTRSSSAEMTALEGHLKRGVTIIWQNILARVCTAVCHDAVLKVILHWTDDVADPQYAVSSDALRRLEGFEDARGRRLKVCYVPVDIEVLYHTAKIRKQAHWHPVTRSGSALVNILRCCPQCEVKLLRTCLKWAVQYAPAAIHAAQVRADDVVCVHVLNIITTTNSARSSLLISTNVFGFFSRQRIFPSGDYMRVPNLAKVHKCPLPGPLYTTKEDVSSLELKPGSRERGHGELPNVHGRGWLWVYLLRVFRCAAPSVAAAFPGVQDRHYHACSGCSRELHLGIIVVLAHTPTVKSINLVAFRYPE